MKNVANCLFCKIIRGEAQSKKVYEDKDVLGFEDINPAAPIHLLFIHKNHTEDLNDLMDSSPQDIADIFKAINIYTKEKGILNKGYRIINNIGQEGGQVIFHTHFHLLAGKRMGPLLKN